jgi:hypothetical protein
MKKIILIYGVIAGAIVATSMVWGFLVSDSSGDGMQMLEIMGYLIMLIALSVIFFGIKKYRDDELGGVITFGTAVMVGLGISGVASIIYVITWEIYLAQTNYAFMSDYIAAALENMEAAGAGPAEIQSASANFDVMAERYRNPLYRLGITFIEIFPVGLLITLISATILRKSDTLPECSNSSNRE